jgi:arylsulfatase A-like enzyme
MTSFALRMMRHNRDLGRRFFMHLNYLPPHQPYFMYPSWLDVYDASDAVIRPNAVLGNNSANTIADYMNLVRGVDIEIGRLLDEIDKLGLDVTVVLTSDHGDMLFSQGEMFKRKPWEEGARVPLIVRGQSWNADRVSYPVGLVDLAKTFSGLGQGLDIRSWRDSVYYEMVQPLTSWANGRWRAIVTEDGWKLAINENGPRLMYDLTNDPYELNDLAGQGLERESELEDRMRQWAAETRDSFFV